MDVSCFLSGLFIVYVVTYLHQFFNFFYTFVPSQKWKYISFFFIPPPPFFFFFWVEDHASNFVSSSKIATCNRSKNRCFKCMRLPFSFIVKDKTGSVSQRSGHLTSKAGAHFDALL